MFEGISLEAWAGIIGAAIGAVALIAYAIGQRQDKPYKDAVIEQAKREREDRERIRKEKEYRFARIGKRLEDIKNIYSALRNLADAYFDEPTQERLDELAREGSVDTKLFALIQRDIANDFSEIAEYVTNPHLRDGLGKKLDDLLVPINFCSKRRYVMLNTKLVGPPAILLETYIAKVETFLSEIKDELALPSDVKTDDNTKMR